MDEEEPITSEQLIAFAKVLEEELEKLSQDIEETPVKGKDERKTQRRKPNVVNSRKSCVKSKMIFQYVLKNMRTIKKFLKDVTAFPKQIQTPLLCE